MVKRLIYSVLACMVCVVCACTHTLGDVSYPNTPVGNMEALWHIIDEKYCFVEEKGVDWDAIYTEYMDSAKQIDPSDKQSDIRLFDQMADMLNRLHDGHVNLYTAFDVSSSNEWYQGYPVLYNSQIINDVYLQNARRAGGLTYTKIAGDSIGYIRYSSFSSSFGVANMYYVLTAFKECKGIVLDVRNNGGGDLTNAYKLAATFMENDTLIGYWQHKSGKGHTDYSSLEPLYVHESDMPNKWFRPVIVLQDRYTYSAANLFVNAMRYAKNALLLGGVSGGGGGMPMSYELPNGWTVRFSSVKMYNADKQSIEEGIAPDIYETLRSSDRDDLIERAVAIINNAYERK